MTTGYDNATDEQIITANAYCIRNGDKVMFRHFVVEGSSPRARNGVQHREYGRSKLRVIEGAPYVRHHGRLQRITASVYTGPVSGNPVVFDLRIASGYLP